MKKTALSNKIALIISGGLILLTSGCGNEIRPTDTSAMNYGVKLTKNFGGRSSLHLDYHQVAGDDNETIGSDRNVSFDNSTVYGGSTLSHDFDIKRTTLKYRFAIAKSASNSFTIGPYVSWTSIDLDTEVAGETVYEFDYKDKTHGIEIAFSSALSNNVNLNFNLGADLSSDHDFREIGLQLEYATESSLGFYAGWYRWKLTPETSMNDPLIELTASGLTTGMSYSF